MRKGLMNNYLPTTPITCCVCDMTFAVSDGFKLRRLKDHKVFFCPNGHAQHFGQKTSHWTAVQTPGIKVLVKKVENEQ